MVLKYLHRVFYDLTAVGGGGGGGGGGGAVNSSETAMYFEKLIMQDGR